MDQVSRPMQIALLAVVFFAAVWFVALRPKPPGGGAPVPAAAPAASAGAADPTGGATAPGVKGLTGAIAKAHGAVNLSEQSAHSLAQQSAQVSGDTPTSSTPAATPAPAKPATGAPTATRAKPGHRRAGARHRGHRAHHRGVPGPRRATAALADHKVLAVLFFNPRAADDRAVRRAFLRQRTHKGKVVLIAVPLAQLASYTAVTRKVPVTGSPTVVVIDRRGTPDSLVGFLDPVEIANHIDDALAGLKKS